MHNFSQMEGHNTYANEISFFKYTNAVSLQPRLMNFSLFEFHNKFQWEVL